MIARPFSLSFVVTAACCVAATMTRAQAPPAPANPAAAPGVQAAPQAAGVLPAQGDPQVLDQGPIHEAYAEPVALDAKPSVVVNQEPPEPINELPPEVKPDGDNVQWIPGYWMWSDEQLNFVWVSGVWRDVPPGRRWVPGHWLKDANSWVWASGFWAGADWQQVQMLPHPPATLEAGPSSPSPGDNYFWVPGCWIWNNGAYAWRTGYWYAGQPNWVWVPDYYAYTPAGSIFVNGYWDRPLWNRGLLFAPVWWPAQAFGYPSFYTPRYVVDSSLLLTSLFINTRYNSYWFGHGGWGNNHFRPWWSFGGWGHGYDPIWAYHRWHDGHRNDWDNHWRNEFDHWHGHGNWNHMAGGPGHGGPGQGGAGGGNNGPGNGGGGANTPIVQEFSRWGRGGRQVGVHTLTDAERGVVQTEVAQSQQLRAVRAQAETRGRGARGQIGNVDIGGSPLTGATVGSQTSIGMRPGFKLPAVARTTGAGDVQVSGGGFRRRSTAGTTSTTNPSTGVTTQVTTSPAGGIERRSAYRGGLGTSPSQGTPLGGSTGGAGIFDSDQQAWPGRHSRSANWTPSQADGGGRASRAYRVAPGADLGSAVPGGGTRSTFSRDLPRFQGGGVQPNTGGVYRPPARPDFGGGASLRGSFGAGGGNFDGSGANVGGGNGGGVTIQSRSMGNGQMGSSFQGGGGGGFSIGGGEHRGGGAGGGGGRRGGH